jgi:hypothetical protein
MVAWPGATVGTSCAGCVYRSESQFRSRALGAIPSSAILSFAASESGARDPGFAFACAGGSLVRVWPSRSAVTAVSEVREIAWSQWRAAAHFTRNPAPSNQEMGLENAASKRLIAGSRSSLLVSTTRWQRAGSSVIETKSRLWLA